MGADGIREFIKWYYGADRRKEGLVVDVRANGGGNVSRMLIERLRRKLLAPASRARTSRANTYPDGVFRGPMVVHPERELGLGRRHLPGDVPRGEARAR